MESAAALLLPVRLRLTHGLSPGTIRELKHLRDGIQLALAHAQASKDKEKFVLPLKEYRRAVDLVLSVRKMNTASTTGLGIIDS